jgi:hypothetical protein
VADVEDAEVEAGGEEAAEWQEGKVVDESGGEGGGGVSHSGGVEGEGSRGRGEATGGEGGGEREAARERRSGLPAQPRDEHSASRTENTGSRTENTVSRTENTASRTENTASRTENTASRTEHAGGERSIRDRAAWTDGATRPHARTHAACAPLAFNVSANFRVVLQVLVYAALSY